MPIEAYSWSTRMGLKSIGNYACITIVTICMPPPFEYFEDQYYTILNLWELVK